MPKAQAVLKLLWEWREEEARKKDRPSFKILNPDILVQSARWAAENPGMDIGLLPDAPRNVKGEYRDALNQVLRDSKNAPPAQLTRESTAKKKKRMEEAASRRFDRLREARAKLAAELKLQPSLLANNAALESIAIEYPKDLNGLRKLNALMNWQTETAGQLYLNAMKNDIIITS